MELEGLVICRLVRFGTSDMVMESMGAFTAISDQILETQIPRYRSTIS